MADAQSVAAVRKSIAAGYKSLLKSSYGRQLSELGSKKKRAELPAISDETGTWAESGIRSKPLAWLVGFHYDAQAGLWRAGSTASPSNEHWRRLAGTFNAGSPLQGIITRVIPVFETPETYSGPEAPAFRPHPYWEWALVFVFPGRAVFADEGSSGATIDFDPATGELSSTIDGRKQVQNYVSSGLFKLLPDDESWDAFAPIETRYGQVSEALSSFINVNTSEPPADIQ